MNLAFMLFLFDEGAVSWIIFSVVLSKERESRIIRCSVLIVLLYLEKKYI